MTGHAYIFTAGAVVFINFTLVLWALLIYLFAKHCREITYYYWAEVMIGLGIAFLLGAALLSGWLGRVVGAASILYGALPPY